VLTTIHGDQVRVNAAKIKSWTHFLLSS